FISHIHLDHSGAVGWLAQQGAVIHVHPNGAPHLINPEKLLNSAKRIYGDNMNSLWGNFIPVPQEKIHTPNNEENIVIDHSSFQVFDTPGHADHHYCILYEGILFSGDIGGIRIAHTSRIELPTPPPEFNPQKWHSSIQLMRSLQPQVIAPTHFGIFTDVTYHLNQLEVGLSKLEDWLSSHMKNNPDLERFTADYADYIRHQRENAVDSSLLNYYDILNPSWMSAAGLYRYWTKTQSN
ncbi:MAG: MBL fold metallo-hydrolase, partial [Anaerolineales bacterium]